MFQALPDVPVDVDHRTMRGAVRGPTDAAPAEKLGVREAFEKTPAAVLRYGVDLQSWLTPGDVVVGATADLLDTNTAVELAEPELQIAADRAIVIIQLKGGELGRPVVSW